MPIKTEYIKLKKSDFHQTCLIAAIDCGKSLTKTLFLNKKYKEEFLNANVTTLTLQFNLFHNADFEKAVEFIKHHTLQLEGRDYKVRLTGALALKNKNRVKSILKKEVILIDKKKAVATGCKIALEHIGIENLLASNVSAQNYGEIDSEMMDKFIKGMEAAFKTEDNSKKDTSSLYPCLFNLSGSSCSYIYFDKEGNSDFYGLINESGKTFLGLAKCLLDTNKYIEVMDLASGGDRSQLDTLVKEMLDDRIDSPYGKFPPDLPIFSFGQCADYNKNLSDLKKKDVAISLVSFFAQDITTQCITFCATRKIPKIYLIGNLFNSDIFQREIKNYISVFPSIIEFVFLNFGFSGVLGAMFYDENLAQTS